MHHPARTGSAPVRTRPRAGFGRRNGVRLVRATTFTAFVFAVGLTYDGRAGAAAPARLIGPVPLAAASATAAAPLVGPVPIGSLPLIGPVPLPAPAPLIGPVPVTEPAGAVPVAGPAADSASPKFLERALALSRLQVVAHRGGTVWGPESTLTSFDHAIEMGADAAELDVQFTKDGVPIVLHDPTLDRTTNCTGPAAAIKLSALKKCDAGLWYTANPVADEHVPTLDETLNLLQGSGMHAYLHIKMASKAQAKTLVKLIDKYGMNRSAKASNPATVMADTKPILDNLKAAGAKRLGFVFHDPSGWKTNYPVLVPIDVPMTHTLVSKAQRKGQFVTLVQYGALTLDQLADLGLDGLMVNDPQDLLGQLGRLDSDLGLGDHGSDSVEGADARPEANAGDS